METKRRPTREEKELQLQALWIRMKAPGDEARQQGAQHVVGVDEVGRGPVAGPIVAAAVELDPERPILGLQDSKKLTARRRELLCAQIEQQALQIHVQWISAQEIDEMGIALANRTVLMKAVEGLKQAPDWVLSDYFELEGGQWICRALVHGDATAQEIAAASIVAKVYRDRYMVDMEAKYPGFGFASNKGYGTAAHRRAIEKWGLTPEHRRSFLTKWL